MSRRNKDGSNHLRHVEPSAITFSMFTKEEILKLSVKKLTTSLTFDALGHPIPGGLYDGELGPLHDKSDPCGTCFKNVYNCPGHFGHIELPVVVVNPLFHKAIATIMKLSCMSCYNLQIRHHIKTTFGIQMQLVDGGHIVEAQELAALVGSLDEQEADPEETESTFNAKLLKKYIKLTMQPAQEQISSKNIEAIRNNFIKSIATSIKVRKICMYCKKSMYKMTTAHSKILIVDNEQVDDQKSSPRMMMPNEIKSKMQSIWKYEHQTLVNMLPILKTLHGDTPTDVMFIDLILILPPLVRPISMVKNTVSEHPQTALYRMIMENSLVIRTIIQAIQFEEDTSNMLEESQAVYKQVQGDSAMEKFHIAWQELQAHVDHLMNKEIPRTNVTNTEGLKQIIEKKTGVIRQHMMGKRVNFAARSVITPDPNLNIHEIGVPETFAKRLTYPVMVTSWNVADLRKMVMNGPDKHPGASMVENEDGSLKLIPNVPRIQESIAKRLLVPETKEGTGHFKGVKIVHRHLLTGDILLLNRQPTLHKPGIMAHAARILKGERTLRMHYANCKAYNADFDGDEMNAHFPQNELARSEAYNIVNVCNQFLVPKDGTPLSGLIQDHMVSGVRLSIRGKFFTKDDYHQLIYTALAHKTGKLILLPPTIIKPCCLWSGKQLISTIIINSIPEGKPLINLTSTAKISSNAWQRHKPRKWKAGGTSLRDANTMSEAEVIIMQGELLTGVLDKTHYGATPYGLIHCVYELYGGQCSSSLLSSFAKLFTSFLQREGFTLGVHDILVVPKADEQRKKFVYSSRLIGTKAAAESVSLSEDTDAESVKAKIEESYAANPKFRMVIDRQYKTALDSFTNNINKTCIPTGLVSQFPNNNLQLMVQSGAKGSMVNCMQISCLLGQIELEGKRPPVMISGRSLPSFPPFETSPRAGGFIDGRFMTGIQPQEFFFHCMAGREGLIDTAVKTSRSGYLQRCLVKHLEGLTVGYDLTVRDCDNSVIQFFYGEDGMDISKAQFLNKKQLGFLAENTSAIANPTLEKMLYEDHSELLRKHAKSIRHWKKKYGSSIQKITHRRSYQEGYKRNRCPDPIVTKFQPDHYAGVLNERLDELVEDYMKSRPNADVSTDFQGFKDMFKIKAMRTLCAPGEPVGLLAAQSIGEPSTQMTLNTFHFAGRGEMNVTLGIPRLREILMMASKHIKTPSMEIPFLPNVPQTVVNKLCKKLNRVTIANILEKVHVKAQLDIHARNNLFTLRFHFLPPELYKNQYFVKPSNILRFMEKKFFGQFFEALKKAAHMKHSIVSVTEKKSKPIANEDTDADTARNLDASSSESDIDDEESHFKHAREDMEPSSNDEKSSDDETKDEPMDDPKDGQEEAVRNNVVNSLRFARNYKFDTKKKLWCELTFALPLSYKQVDITAVLKDTANKSVIWQTPQIKRAITYMNNAGELMLRTDGINIGEMFKYIEILDVQRLFSNDIHGIAATYGIEAATRVIVKEVRDVFNVYGITVDPRHLSLIADYMTFDGVFQPLSRKGMEDGASPLQQMSFESSLVFLKNAVINGKIDSLRSPSSCLMVGYPCHGGTGAFSLVHAVR